MTESAEADGVQECAKRWAMYLERRAHNLLDRLKPLQWEKGN